MKKLISLFLFILLVTCSIISEENNDPSTPMDGTTTEKIPVYICDGQSNARAEWAYAVITEIKKTEPNAIVLWTHHPGCSISEWWDGDAKQDLLEDCQYFINELNGIDYDVRGFFWFQGEADRYADKFPYYTYRFINMINYLKFRINDSEFDIMISYVYSTLPDHDMKYIRLVQKNMVNNYNDYYGFDSMGYPRYDGLHLTLPGRVLFGGNQANYYLNNR